MFLLELAYPFNLMRSIARFAYMIVVILKPYSRRKNKQTNMLHFLQNYEIQQKKNEEGNN